MEHCYRVPAPALRMAAVTRVQEFAEGLLARERVVASEFDLRFWEGLLQGREYALLAEQLVCRGLKRGTLTDGDRSAALSLLALSAVHWRIRAEKKSA